MQKLSDYFEGYYYKHQKDDNTLCLIVGQAGEKRFIQVITKDFSVRLPFSEGNYFSKEGIVLNIRTRGISLSGKIRYGTLTPIRYDIMGPFRFFPMECRHGIVSMSHDLYGGVVLNGEEIDFTGGKGYIEMDSGRSFPVSYLWMQANDFPGQSAIVVSIATIPFYGLRFLGSICVIHHGGREYRLATYLGAEVILCSRELICLRQGKYRLEVRIKDGGGYELDAPQNGKMRRTIAETASCEAEVLFWIGNEKVLWLHTMHAGFEYEMS